MTDVADFTILYIVDRDFTAQPNHLYMVQAATMNVTVTLPAQATAAGQPLIIKRVNSGSNTITILPASGEHLNGLDSSTGWGLNQTGQGRWFWPGAPAGPAAGTGWFSY